MRFDLWEALLIGGGWVVLGLALEAVSRFIDRSFSHASSQDTTASTANPGGPSAA